jgi:CheY-like chemotaxis protein
MELAPNTLGADVGKMTKAPTILLVEDTEDNRQMMRRLLEMSGYQVVEALNGREAIETALRVRPQIILMDLSLPFIDGLAATRQIRSNADMDEVTRLIFITKRLQPGATPTLRSQLTILSLRKQLIVCLPTRELHLTSLASFRKHFSPLVV